MNSRFFSSSLVLVVLFGSLLCAADLQKDIVYAKRGDRELKIDICVPDNDSKLRPALIFIHGGGWRQGSRQGYHKRMSEISDLMGYVTATVEYRLTDVASWPAQLDDVRDAYRWLVEHANDYSIDSERMAAMGHSAGGHLSLMLGLLPEEQKESARLRAIANFFGPADLTKVDQFQRVREVLEALVGGDLSENAEKLTHASPVTYVNRTDTPILTFHGTEDPIVPFAQAKILHKALEDNQIPNTLWPMQGVGHTVADRETIHGKLAAFLNSYLVGSTMPLVAHEDFDAGADRWLPTDVDAWKQVSADGRSFFSLTKKVSDYQPKVRSPHNIALLKDTVVGDFVLDVDLRSTNEPYGHQSLCLFFGHQDPSHFYYVHFGREADAHANSIFLVNDAPRVSIAESRTDGTDWSRGWHRARIKRTTETGRIEVYFDDMEKPAMTATDKHFTHGRIGVGSFDDMGDFDSIRLYGKLHK